MVRVLSYSTLEHSGYRFLIMDTPTDDNMSAYIEILKKNNVEVLVRVCESIYDNSAIKYAGFNFVELFYPDGDEPTDAQIKSWLKIVEESKKNLATTAIHCIAGLGRAPYLVAIALIELTGISALQAVELIRKSRRGSINRIQFELLSIYKPKYHKVYKSKLIPSITFLSSHRIKN